MTDAQFEVVANSFLDRHNLNQVMWTSFKDAVENLFTPKDLEKDPTRPVEPIERYVIAPAFEGLLTLTVDFL